MVIEKRRVYDIINLLGDFGGIFSSVYFLGAVIHFLLFSSQEAHRMLTDFFKVEDHVSTAADQLPPS